MRWGRRLALCLSAVALAACPVEPPADDDDSGGAEPAPTPTPDPSGEVPATLEIGPPVACADPVEGFDRLRPAATERGLSPDLRYVDGPKPCLEILGGLVSSDLDGDGDPDLLFHDRDGFPLLYANDGDGHFSPRLVSADVRGTWGRSVLSHAALDLDGDRLPEVVATGPGLVLMARNLGGLQFAPWEVLYEEPGWPRRCFNTQTWGDVDGDGDLDLFLPSIDPVVDADALLDFTMEGPPPGWGPTLDPLLLNVDGAFELVAELPMTPAGEAGLSILGVFTDRDDDGDLDLLVAADRAAGPPLPPTAFFRNDGVDADGRPILVNDAAEIGADLPADGMGLGSGDFNGDGVLDYCFSDIRPHLQCLLSDGAGGYYEGGAALGLTIAAAGPTPQGDPGDWSGWSVEFVDLDNDGWPDVAGTGGGQADVPFPDVLWQGLPGGQFLERSAELGFDDPASHFGMAADDFDGDGSPDLVISGWRGPVSFWENPCSSQAWVDIELVGAGLNSEAIGARVELGWGDGRRELREVHALRTMGQSSSRTHVGLGGAEGLDSLRVRWPGGGPISVAEDLPVRRVITVLHPDAAR